MNIKKLFSIFLFFTLFNSFFYSPYIFAKEKDPNRISIGITWQGKATMQDRLSAGLLKRLNERAPQIDIEWQKEVKDMDELGKVVKRFEKEKDGMVVLRSSGAVYLKDNPPSIPAFIGGCNDPFMLGVLGGVDKPRGLLTGVTYALSYNSIFLTFKRLFPRINSMLLVYEQGHPGALVDRAGSRKAAQRYGIEYNEVGISSVEDRLPVAREWRNKVSVIVLANNALVFDDLDPVIVETVNTPVLAYSEAAVVNGALCGFSANDEKLGEMLADSIVDVLVKGKNIKDIPIKYDENPQIYINLDAANNYDIFIPPALLKVAVIISSKK